MAGFGAGSSRFACRDPVASWRAAGVRRRAPAELCAIDPLLAHDHIALPRSKGDQMWRRNVVRAALRLHHPGRARVRGLSGHDLRTSRGKQETRLRRQCLTPNVISLLPRLSNLGSACLESAARCTARHGWSSVANPSALMLGWRWNVAR